jgi:hypothetical protein
MLLELSYGQLKEEESWMGNCGILSAEVWMKNFVPSVAAAGLSSRGASHTENGLCAKFCVIASNILQRQLKASTTTMLQKP